MALIIQRRVVRRRVVLLSVAGAAVALVAVAPNALAAAHPPGATRAATPTWVDAWAAAPLSSAAEPTDVPTFTNQTVRLVTHLHAAGTRVRLRLSNSFGDRAETFGHVTVGVRGGGAAVVTPRPVTFAGRSSVTVAVGKEIVSDPVTLAVKADQDLAVSVYLPTATGPATWHRSAIQTNYVSTAGDHAAEPAGTAFTTTASHWFFLDAVSVAGGGTPGTIVALGDSITDGSGSKGNGNGRWPDLLYERLAAAAAPVPASGSRPAGAPAARPRAAGTPALSVVDEGIAGNKVLSDDARSGVSAEHRLGRDVLSRAGVRYVVMLEGINDLRDPVTQATGSQVIHGYKQIIARVHARHLKIIGATITPVEGSARYTPAMEQARQQINTWIRTSGAFDGVIDFASAVADPTDPLRILPADDSGDHLHPNQTGYHAMADVINLSLFR